MPRTSRKDRKIQRQRATNAADRGLPAPSIETRGPAGTSASGSPLASDFDDGSAGSTGPSPANRRGWFASWPLSIKVFGLATLVLLGIGLWRTLSAKHDTNVNIESPPPSAPPQTGAR